MVASDCWMLTESLLLLLLALASLTVT